VTRALIAVATTIHLRALQMLINASYVQVARAKRKHDSANTALSYAQAAVSAARIDRQIAREDERDTIRDHNTTVTAAVAEADSLRRGHSVG
jgi:hypothetical protein